MKYTAEQKDNAVVTAERTNLTEASRLTGIPRQTIQYWYHSPEFGDLRHKTREELAEGATLGAHLALGEILDRIRAGKLRDTALVAAFGVFVDKAQLLTGMATQRTESRDITGTLSDAELADAVRTAERLLAGVAGEAEGAPED